MIEINPMEPRHIDAVYDIETSSFSAPWSRESFEEELANKLAIYSVAEDDGRVVGYAGMWHVVTEGHITNIAVAPERRREGIGALLLENIIETARRREMIGITLEVRMGNADAMGLYARYGFKAEGIRKNYYSDTKEDAVIMWKYLN